MSVATYQIRGRARLSAMAVAAALSIVGVAATLLAEPLGWGRAGATAGTVLVGLSVVMVLLGVNAARRASVTATLNDDAFVLVGPDVRVALPWQDVRQVAMAGNALILRDVSGREITVQAPRGSRPEELDALAAALAHRLDASRGYRPL